MNWDIQKRRLPTRRFFEINPHLSYLKWKKIWQQLGAQKNLAEESELMTVDNVLYPVKASMCLSIGEKRNRLYLYDQKFVANQPP